MSRRIPTALHSATQCSFHSTRRCAPRGYLFLRDDQHSGPSRRPFHPRSRTFSTSPRCAAARSRQVKPTQSQPAQPSMEVQMKRAQQRALRSGEIPDDLGLLPETFVMPFGQQKPGWLDKFKERLKLERARSKQKIKDFWLYFAFWYYIRLPNPANPFKIASVAKELHKEMFANFATGDLLGLNKKLCNGILTSLQRRIDQRPRGTSYLWQIHSYISAPSLVSYKLYPFPETVKFPKAERHGISQAVVRIHSKQSLRPLKRVRVREGTKVVEKEMIVDARGQEFPRERLMESSAVWNAKETVEYVVLQRVYKLTEPGPWKIWGTTEETSLEKVEALKERKAKAKQRGKVKGAVAGEGEKGKVVA